MPTSTFTITSKRVVSAALALATLTVAGCNTVQGVSNEGASVTATQSVEVRFAGIVGDLPFRCGTNYSAIGKPVATVRPTDFRFYVTGVSLLDRRGQKVPLTLDQDGLWQYRDVALIDFEDGSGPCRGGNAGLNASVKGTVTKGNYAGIEFEVGLPFDLNHGDVTKAPVPLNYTSMFWSWRSGYRFFKIDMEAQPEAGDQAGKATGFSIHIGGTGCEPGSSTTSPSVACKTPNHIAVRFDQFDPAQDIVTVDLATILAATNARFNTPNTPPGCMSGPEDPECPGVFDSFGLPFPGQPTRPQRAFRKGR